MHLVLAAHRQLRRHYGADYGRVSAALSDALAARTESGIATRAYDPEQGLPDLGVPPAELTPTALRAQLAALKHALATRNGIMIESLWIIGGPDIVPFGSLPNPMRDRDGPILSDCVYGLADAEDLLPQWPVGRMPDIGSPGSRRLDRLLGLVAQAHRAGPRPPGPTLGVSTARWAAVSSAVLAAAGEPAAALLLAPPLAQRRARHHPARAVAADLLQSAWRLGQQRMVRTGRQ